MASPRSPEMQQMGPAAMWRSQLPGFPQQLQASGHSPWDLASRDQIFPGQLAGGQRPLVSPYSGHQEEPIPLGEVEALSRRVQEVLRRCNMKLDSSRLGLEDLSEKRHGFVGNLLEAERDFTRMGDHWGIVEDELKLLRRTIQQRGNLSPRAQAKLAQAMANGDAYEGLQHGHGAQEVGDSPRSEDGTDRVGPMNLDWLHERREGHHVGGEHIHAPLAEEGSDELRAILDAARRSSESPAAILEAVTKSHPLQDQQWPAERSTFSSPSRNSEPNLQEVGSRSSFLEMQLKRLSTRTEPSNIGGAVLAMRKTELDSHHHGHDDVTLPPPPSEDALIRDDLEVKEAMRFRRSSRNAAILF